MGWRVGDRSQTLVSAPLTCSEFSLILAGLVALGCEAPPLPRELNWEETEAGTGFWGPGNWGRGIQGNKPRDRGDTFLCLTEEFWGELWAGLQALGEKRKLSCLRFVKGKADRFAS